MSVCLLRVDVIRMYMCTVHVYVRVVQYTLHFTHTHTPYTHLYTHTTHTHTTHTCMLVQTYMYMTEISRKV